MQTDFCPTLLSVFVTGPRPPTPALPLPLILLFGSAFQRLNFYLPTAFHTPIQKISGLDHRKPGMLPIVPLSLPFDVDGEFRPRVAALPG